jgi:hypothetical protein
MIIEFNIIWRKNKNWLLIDNDYLHSGLPKSPKCFFTRCYTRWGKKGQYIGRQGLLYSDLSSVAVRKLTSQQLLAALRGVF